MYDHLVDPGEYVNLASDPEYADVLTKMRKWLPEVDAEAAERETGN